MPAKSLLRAVSPVSESEKVTVNVGFVDLGQIDLLVSEGFYSNRTDFIRTAIRQQLQNHRDEVRDVTARKQLVVGLQNYSRADLEALRDRGEALDLNVLGLLTVAPDVTPDLALDTIASLRILGAWNAPAAVKTALRPRLR
jgi:Arc/MetJ-type ribon-helix-helix transcriptional regulator